jgi:microcystin-dependent protein
MDPFIGQIGIFSFNYAPKNWAMCNGQLMPINQNQALYALLGTTYGGNGSTNFALPNLQSRTPIHTGNGFVQGQAAGAEGHTLHLTELPQHSHTVSANSGVPNAGSPTGNSWASMPEGYSTSSNAVMNASAIGNAGGSQPHSNMQPYLTLNFCIALFGIFPSRN